MLALPVLFVISLALDTTLACDGYKIRFNKITNCADDNVLTIDTNFTTSINKKCEVSSVGCVTSLGFTEAKVKYTVSKNGIKIMDGEPDLCDEMNKDNKEAIKKMEMLGIPTHCPIPEGRQCVDDEQKMDVTKYKKYLALARGKVTVKADITHDKGKSCLNIEFEVYK